MTPESEEGATTAGPPAEGTGGLTGGSTGDPTGRPTPGPSAGLTASLTERQVADLFAGMNEVIRAGEEMRRTRAEMIQLFADAGWTQDRLARLAGMSQPAVSKQVSKPRTGEAADLSLDLDDTPWLEGRLWGLAEELSEALDDTAHCARPVHALARGRKRFTPQNVDALRRLIEADLRERAAELPGAYREAYDRIARALDTQEAQGGATEAGSPSARRALARQIQRVRLRDAG
ncbi:sigma-70 family RNA polymerase sigma factor [Streptomyces sp. NPDC054835]|uniref:sigma-70 family RNA polymerase sigma factor n=1 Tax=Streptomyces sp. NBC_01268 TaxID=2903806 RepID=UPI002E359D0C|nr:sigma-70 family RNA polymerase sigma factor [Streptomyces sp. NBC_01268]